MRILFSVRNPSYVRYYDSALRALAARGHTVELASQAGKRAWPPSALALASECPQIRLSTLPDVAFNPWWELATRLRQARFYLRFLQPEYEQTPELLARTRARAPKLAVWLGEAAGRTAIVRRLLVQVTDVLEQSTRAAALFRAYLEERRPDVLVTTPLIVLKTAQLDLARAAVEIGIRNVFAVASWDHLSSKGELTFAPQHVFVWNETQKREAQDLHDIDPARITITGAPVFDEWFSRSPSSSRTEFFSRMGLQPDRPVILYVCSSLLEGSPAEAPFVLRWVRHLRQSNHPILRSCGILVRPHPHRGREWRGVDLSQFENMACWPPLGEMPAERPARDDYFHSLYHSSATVGLNTSAMIESAILGRPVFTILLSEFQHSQEGTLHFRYLLAGPDPFLRVSRSLDDHTRDLALTLETRNRTADTRPPFIEAFVRPRGVDVPATELFVDAIERIAAQPAPAPVAVPVWTGLIRPFLWVFAQAAARRARRVSQAFRDEKVRRLIEHRRRKAADVVARAGTAVGRH